MKLHADDGEMGLYSLIPWFQIVDSNTCGLCRPKVLEMAHFVPVVIKKTIRGMLIRGYRVELCETCHEMLQANHEELKRTTKDLTRFIRERVRTGQSFPIQFGGEFPKWRR